MGLELMNELYAEGVGVPKRDSYSSRCWSNCVTLGLIFQLRCGLKRVRGVGIDDCVRSGNGKTDERAGVGDDRSQSPAAHRSSSVAVSTDVASPS